MCKCEQLYMLALRHIADLPCHPKTPQTGSSFPVTMNTEVVQIINGQVYGQDSMTYLHILSITSKKTTLECAYMPCLNTTIFPTINFVPPVLSTMQFGATFSIDMAILNIPLCYRNLILWHEIMISVHLKSLTSIC